jgi:DNA-binding response OmpR family regulator
MRPISDVSGKQTPHILIAEDNKSMADFIGDLLENNYRISYANTGSMAWDLLRKQSFDLVISDVMMPEMDGFELVKRLRETEKLQSLPVIILSAMALPEDKVYGFKLGVNDYLGKPFHPAELKARVQHLLERAMVRHEVETEGAETEISVDEAFIIEARKQVEEHLSDPGFGVKQLAADLNYSERNLQRWIKKQTGLTSVQFIREIRLLEAYTMLQGKTKHTVTEVSYAVGFESASYFSKTFQKRFGISPKELMK